MNNILSRLAALLPKRRYVYISAVTGRFVSRAYAVANPATTIRRPR